MKYTNKYGLFLWSEDNKTWVIMRVGTKYNMYKHKKLFEIYDKERNVKSKFKVKRLKCRERLAIMVL